MQRTPQRLHKSPIATVHISGGGAYQAARGVHFPPHHHTIWELVYYRSGAPVCVMSGKPFPGYAGLVWLTPPGITHAERAVTEYSNYYIGCEIRGRPDWPAFVDDDGDRSIERVCRQIVIECQRKSAGHQRMLELLGEELACLLQRTTSEKALPTREQIVARAERVIDERCSQPLTIRDVARAANTSASALRAHFQEVRGCSPREYLRQARLGRAIGLLRTSSLKLEAVAEMCGFDSASHLTRTVKRATRRTPGQIRAK